MTTTRRDMWAWHRRRRRRATTTTATTTLQWVPCFTCSGAGVVLHANQRTLIPCPDCDGTRYRLREIT